jgi:hypothetical protein
MKDFIPGICEWLKEMGHTLTQQHRKVLEVDGQLPSPALAVLDTTLTCRRRPLSTTPQPQQHTKQAARTASGFKIG